MGHHVLNHMMEDVVNAEIMGATTGLLSGILMGAIAGGLGASDDTVADLVEEAMEDGWESGRQSGRLLYSVDQESEADNFALQIIKLAGYSQAEARNVLFYIGTNSSELRSDHNTTHPTGPKRIAAFDLYTHMYKPDKKVVAKRTSQKSRETATQTAKYKVDAQLKGPLQACALFHPAAKEQCRQRVTKKYGGAAKGNGHGVP